ncbi:MAG: hypothetical protein FWF28_05460 [Micrococcales bacterium]|nr:hypothetical protein [Micrococcales bacterium]
MTLLPEVQTTSEARIALSATLERFRAEGLATEPLFFGNHRKAEAVIIPVALYQVLADAIDEARSRPSSPRP